MNSQEKARIIKQIDENKTLSDLLEINKSLILVISDLAKRSEVPVLYLATLGLLGVSEFSVDEIKEMYLEDSNINFMYLSVLEKIKNKYLIL